MKSAAKKLIDNGNPLALSDIEEGDAFAEAHPDRIRVFNAEGRFAGVYSYEQIKGKFMPDKMFQAD